MLTKEFITKQFCDGGIDAIVGLIHALEIKPLIEEVLNNFDFEKVATIIRNTSEQEMSPEELRTYATKMLMEVSAGFESGKPERMEANGLVAEYNIIGGKGTLHLGYVAETSNAAEENHYE